MGVKWFRISDVFDGKAQQLQCLGDRLQPDLHPIAVKFLPSAKNFSAF